MKLNNRGWGLQELLVGLGVLFFCLLLIVSLINRNFKQLGDTINRIDQSKQDKSPTTEEENPKTEEKEFRSYKEIEISLISAAKKYSEDIYGDDLQEGDNITVTVRSLIREQYLEKISDLEDENVICSGYVTFSKHGNHVSYNPYLKCGNHYKTSGYLERLDVDIE